ncbi:Flocculation suppression protein, partial [Massospora cicadina]
DRFKREVQLMAGLQAKMVPAFVEKLQAILEDVGLQKLISWNDGGESFSVHDYNEFARTVLPNHFKHSNWQSFVRQLNMYGFSKVSDAFHLKLASWEFRHPAFKRGRPELYPLIKRRAPKPVFKPSPISSRSPQPPSEPNQIFERLASMAERLEALERRVEWQADIIGNLQDQLTASRQAHQYDHTKLEIAIRALSDLHTEANLKRIKRDRRDCVETTLLQESSSPPILSKNPFSDSIPQPCTFRLPPISSLDTGFYPTSAHLPRH